MEKMRTKLSKLIGNLWIFSKDLVEEFAFCSGMRTLKNWIIYK